MVLWREKSGTQRWERERKRRQRLSNELFGLLVRTENLPGDTQAQVTFKKKKKRKVKVRKANK